MAELSGIESVELQGTNIYIYSQSLKKRNRVCVTEV